VTQRGEVVTSEFHGEPRPRLISFFEAGLLVPVTRLKPNAGSMLAQEARGTRTVVAPACPRSVCPAPGAF
jgi:hypothetical protein